MSRKVSNEGLKEKVSSLECEIAALKKEKKTLVKDEERLRILYQSSFEGLGLHEEGKILDANPALARMTGYLPSDLIAMEVTELVTSEWRNCVLRNIRSGYESPYEVIGLRKDGTVYPMEIRGKNVSFEGKESRVISMRDITERKQAEELYRTMAEKSQAGVFIIQAGEFKYLNMNCAMIAGYTPDELVGKFESYIIHPYDWTSIAENTRNMLKGKQSSPIEFRVITKDGKVKWLMQAITSITYQGKPAILGNVMDITQLKEASEKLADLEALEASILDAIPHAVLGFESRRVFFANNAVESVFGWKPLDLIGKSSRLLYRNDEDYENIGKAFYDDEEEKRVSIEEFPCRTSDGRDIVCMVSGAKFGESAEDRKVVAVYEDVTERVRMNEALREEKDRAQKYLDIAGAIILAINPDGNVSLINQKGCEILQYKQQDIIGKNWFDNFMPAKIQDEVKAVFSKLLAGKIRPVEYFENPVVTKDGEERIISWHNTIIRDDADNVVGTLASGEDVTEQKRAEAKLLDYYRRLRLLSSELSLTEQRERQQIATELHDGIGQSMAVSKIKLDALLKSATSDTLARSLREVIDIADQLIQDTRSLTFELSPPVLTILGLDAALEWLSEQFQKKHGIRAKFRKDGQMGKLDNDISFFLFRSTQELLMNVAKHAQAHFVLISMKKYRKEIRVQVEDDGIGLDTRVIESPMDGTAGFGILSIRERLHYLGGNFSMESERGKGTRVTMVVPTSVPKRVKGEK